VVLCDVEGHAKPVLSMSKGLTLIAIATYLSAEASVAVMTTIGPTARIYPVDNNLLISIMYNYEHQSCFCCVGMPQSACHCPMA
jgi:hypothetical protein